MTVTDPSPTPPTTATWTHEPPPWSPTPETPTPPRRRRGRRAAAVVGVLALTLAAGVTGGVVGAALDDEPAAGSGIVRSTGQIAEVASADGSVEGAAATIAPSVVTIEVAGGVGPFGRSTGGGTGSGVVLRSDGYVLTNNHVVAGADTVTVTLSDGTEHTADVVGTDPDSDLAVLRVTGDADLTAAAFADSDELEIGQTVLAVGSPLGLSNTVTQGIVSAVQRPVRTGDSGTQTAILDAIQTDAAINPGNSGGALVDLAGRVVGINSAIATVSESGNIGVGFAIPANEAVDVAEQLIADGSAEHPSLGVSVGNADGGAGIADVVPGGPAAAAGLEAGDVVTRVGERRVTDVDGLIAAIRDHEPGEQVAITFLRDGRAQTVTATLGRRTSS